MFAVTVRPTIDLVYRCIPVLRVSDLRRWQVCSPCLHQSLKQFYEILSFTLSVSFSTVMTHHFQPAILRLPSLLSLLVITLVLIALTELACRQLPSHNSNGFISSIQDAPAASIDALIHARHAKRQDNGTSENGGGTETLDL